MEGKQQRKQTPICKADANALSCVQISSDGHFGLWLDDSFEKGVSSPCQTFGNEPLSDEGTKFDVLGVEIWYIGS